MLVDLYVKNLAVIEEVRMSLGPGLTVLSGDEGAGKSLLVDALSLLLGGRASTTLVRSSAGSALVEGVFQASPEDEGLTELLSRAGLELEPDGTLILAREVQEQGRSLARVNGRAVPLSLLRDVGQRLMDIHSQMEHLSLLQAQKQLDVLDAHGALLGARSGFGAKLAALRLASKELDTLSGEDARRRRELLEFHLAEIEASKVAAGEDEELQQEWQILRRAEALKEGCYSAHASLYGDSQSATGLVHQAIKALRGMALIDPALHGHLDALTSAALDLEETARDIRSYAEAVESRSGRLEQVEERLELLRKLKSKHGPTIEEVVAYAGRARTELDELENLHERRRHLEGQVERLEAEAGRLAGELSAARQEALLNLVQAVNSELSDLGMPWARFDISLRQVERQDGLPAARGRYAYGPSGVDRVEFLGVTNPGEPLKPLGDIASGGETCRFMLAVNTALRQADPVSTLVFDEIDMGVGGRKAHIVGRKLAALARDRQVICITHLPQIACYGQSHHKVHKEVRSGRASTRIELLDGEARVRELAAMLGSYSDGSMLDSARELLARAGDGDGGEIGDGSLSVDQGE
ncbi:MAG: DNA repair protein RecN [Dehalococcoidia bacterium]|nr:DNA repair protein RecN [Dehalococcoidia bacterium]